MKANFSQRTAASVGSGPRTRLPFLRKVVQDAARSPCTHQSASPFTEYLSPSTGTERQRESKVLYKDPQCIVVNDAFPKAKLHCLVMPLDLSLESLNALRAEHVVLLRHMMDVSQRYLEFLRTQASEKGYLFPSVLTGFHAIPSLPHLHMHLISMDFESSALKTKKHYNSFVTPFFLPASDVVVDLEHNGRITLNQEVRELKHMEEQAPKCLWCGHSGASMPQLKAHLRVCPRSRAYLQD